jgi:uncharacterized protein (TIGR03435 family)
MMRALGIVVFAGLATNVALTQEVTNPVFDVASVKLTAGSADTGGPSHSTGFRMSIDPQQVVYTGATLKFLLLQAYALKSYQVDGPDWLDVEKYDLFAKLPTGAEKEQVPAMLQSLLVERFQMRTHWESKERPVYALVEGKRGNRLKASQVTGGAAQQSAGLSFTSQGHMEFHQTTLAGLADTLTHLLNLPILDMTNIPGEFDITLDLHTTLGGRPEVRAPGPGTEGANSPLDATDSLFSAISDLGLKLEARKTPIRHLVVDAAIRTPTAN